MTMQMNMGLTFLDFNKPVNIILPDGAANTTDVSPK